MMSKMISRVMIVPLFIFLAISVTIKVEASGPCPGSMLGSGIISSPCVVENIEDLASMNSDTYTLALSYILADNLDFNDSSSYDDYSAHSGLYTVGSGFTPIGNNVAEFTGSFNGSGFTISNMMINRPTTGYVGLFGETYQASIFNIGMINVSVSGASHAGGLVGRNSNTAITNSYTTGVVTSTGSYTGGLIGQNYNNSIITDSHSTVVVTSTGIDTGGLIGNNHVSTIIDSYATGAVTSTAENVGGLVGLSFQGSTITNAYATGVASGAYYVGGLVGLSDTSYYTNAYATGVVTGTSYVGGLVGYAKNSTTITDSYATGAVTGTALYVGGLVGKADSSYITSSFATSAVSGNDNVGGLVGKTYMNSIITSTYATGKVTGVDYTGGLVGANLFSSIKNSYSVGDVDGVNITGGLVGVNSNTIINSYSAGDTSGVTNVGGLVGSVSGSFSEITNSYYFDFMEITNETNTVGDLATLENLDTVSWHEAVIGSGLDSWKYDGINDGYYPLLFENGSITTELQGQTLVSFHTLGASQSSNNSESSISIRIDGESRIVELGSSYKNPMATAWSLGTIISDKIVINGNVDTTKVGGYQLLYSVSHNGETEGVIITIQVVDTKKPVFWSLADQLIYKGTKIDWTILLGKVWDSSEKLVKTGTANVNENTAGEYKVLITVTDESGNEGKSSANVTVSENQSDFNQLTYKKGRGINFDYDVKKVLGYYETYKMKVEYLINEVDFETEGKYMVVVKTRSLLRSTRIETIFVDIIK